MSKKILIITYYWPPSGGVGGQRWLKLVRTFTFSQKWEPIIYTPENPDFSQIDHSLEKRVPKDIIVLKTPIREPYFLLKYIPFVGSKISNTGGTVPSAKTGNFFQNVVKFIRANIFIPDPRMLWINPSVRYLKKYLTENQVDAIITTGPPHSMHLIGLKLKKLFPDLPWLADFRDPWTNWDFNYDLKPLSFVRKKHLQLEKEVLKNADVVVTVSHKLKENFDKIVPREVKVLYNGFDSTEFDSQLTKKTDYSTFIICHFGIMGESRNPIALWEALRELVSENAEFKSKLKIHLAGSVSQVILNILYHSDLKDCVIYHEYLNRVEVMEHYQNADILLMILNQNDNAKWILPVKMFEYLKIGKPVLGVGPTDSEAAEILKASNIGNVFEYDAKDLMKHFVEDVYKGQFKINPEVLNQTASKFNVNRLAVELDMILEEMIKK